MRFVVPLVTLVAIALGALPDHVKEKFEEFKKLHGLNCTEVECAGKFANFGKRLARLEDLQAKQQKAGKKYSLGMTKFMTWSEEEMKALLHHEPVPDTRVPKMKEHAHRKKRQVSNMDWRDYGFVGAVRNQGSCGSCWAFAAVASVETQWNALGHSDQFSEQQLVDCNTVNHGCGGGWYDAAFAYQAAKGCIRRSDYTYFSGSTGTGGTCKQLAASRVVASNSSVWAATVGSMEEAVTYYGPVSIWIYVPESFFYYTGGVFDPDQTTCTYSTSVGAHAMAVIGFGTDPVEGDYWLVRNSWGTNWGDAGYMRMKKGINSCMIEDYAVLPIVNGQQAVWFST